MSALPAARPSGPQGAMPMIAALVRAYPGRSVAALAAVFAAGLLDGLGLSMLLSMLTLAGGSGSGAPSLPQRVALSVTHALGLQATPLTLLALATALISAKAASPCSRTGRSGTRSPASRRTCAWP
jgi:ATP-binding cassette, subfamily C, bacterial